MAGYSGRPLHAKLGLKPDYKAVLLNAPDDYADLLGPDAPDVVAEAIVASIAVHANIREALKQLTQDQRLAMSRRIIKRFYHEKDKLKIDMMLRTLDEFGAADDALIQEIVKLNLFPSSGLGTEAWTLLGKFDPEAKADLSIMVETIKKDPDSRAARRLIFGIGSLKNHREPILLDLMRERVALESLLTHFNITAHHSKYALEQATQIAAEQTDPKLKQKWDDVVARMKHARE